MTMQMLLAVAKPWTYWIAPPLLISVLTAMAVVAVGYYRKVMVPSYLWRIEAEKRGRQDPKLAEVRTLRSTPPAESMPAAA